MADPNVFPYTPQTLYTDMPEAPLPGDVYEYEHHNSRVQRGMIAKVTEASQTNTIQIGANNPGDTVGVTIDGGTVSVIAGANAGATALLLEAALEAAAFLSIDASTNADTVTLVFDDAAVHTVVEYNPDATTATVLTTQAAVGQEQLVYGMGVAKRLPVTTANHVCVVKPSSMDDTFAGVLFRTHGTNLPPDQIQAAGFDPAYLCPGYVYSAGVANIGIVVDYVGDVPAPGDPVYWIKTGADAGLWRIDDGGTSEVALYTVTTSVADDIAFDIDGYPTLLVAATNNAVNDTASLVALWNASPFYAALGTVVDNLDGTFTVTYADRNVHVFTDASTGANAVAESITTAAVAASAELRPNLAWAKPSITSDPPRAFLRLSNP